MLQQGMGKNPDALYILAQTVLVQKYALEQAQAQLAQAKAQIEQAQEHPEPKHATSFLGNLLGRNDGPPSPPPPAPGQGWTQVPTYAQGAPVPVGYPQYGPPMGMGGGGGFLQGALQTAAGVAAGALAFQGVESLMHGFGHAAGYGGQAFGGLDGGQRPEEVINNYYGDDRGGREASTAERSEGDRENREFGGRDDRGSQQGDDGGGLDDRGTSDFADTSSYDDSASNLDDASFDDGGSSFDDGGSGGDDGSFA